MPAPSPYCHRGGTSVHRLNIPARSDNNEDYGYKLLRTCQLLSDLTLAAYRSGSHANLETERLRSDASSEADGDREGAENCTLFGDCDLLLSLLFDGNAVCTRNSCNQRWMYLKADEMWSFGSGSAAA